MTGDRRSRARLSTPCGRRLALFQRETGLSTRKSQGYGSPHHRPDGSFSGGHVLVGDTGNRQGIRVSGDRRMSGSRTSTRPVPPQQHRGRESILGAMMLSRERCSRRARPHRVSDYTSCLPAASWMVGALGGGGGAGSQDAGQIYDRAFCFLFFFSPPSAAPPGVVCAFPYPPSLVLRPLFHPPSLGYRSFFCRRELREIIRVVDLAVRPAC